MHGVDLARALHVLAVVIWIGGAAMTTSVILPAIRSGDLGDDRLKAFHAIERRFIWQAHTAVLVVGPREPGWSNPASSDRQLKQALLHDRIPIADVVNPLVITLEEAPKGYANFDKVAPMKFVLDFHGTGVKSA